MIAFVILGSGILNLIMGILVLLGGKEKKGINSFVFISFMTFVWATCNFFIYKSSYEIAARMSYAAGAMVMASFIVWVYNFSADQKFKKLKSLGIYAIGTGLASLPLATNLIIDNIQKSEISGFEETTGSLFPVYVVFFIFSYILVLVKLVKHFRKSEGEKKDQTRMILTGFSLYVGISVLFSFILPMFNYQELIDFDVPSSLIFVTLTTYAIVQYKWMDIKVVAFEFLAVVIVGISFMEVFLAGTSGQRIYKAFVFAALTTLSIFMVRSVLSEVKRKEDLQMMSDKLAEANDQLRKLDNAKSEFISIASHQLRTPLTAIKGFVSLLLEGSYGKLEPKQQDALNKVYLSNDRLINLVEDLLNISRIESGRMEFKFDNWNVENICKEVIDTFILRAKEHNLYLNYVPPKEPLPEVMIDGTKIREVISNMVDNAIKYTPRGGVTLTIEKVFGSVQKVESDAGAVRVIVSDTGIGIPQAELPYLFAKFSRGKDISRLNTGGTGLGLYVGRSMIENNGGKIWAESDGEGKGSRFIIEIPLQQSKELLERWG